MGTNYYAQADRDCPHCGTVHSCNEGVHLGKSSYGWQFVFAYNDGEYYKDVKGLKRWLDGRVIHDEYGEVITQEQFWAKVDSKQGTVNPSDGHFMVIDGYRFIDGEFS